MADSAVFEDEDFPDQLVRAVPIASRTSHNRASFGSNISWFVGKLDILTGLASLGVATAILAVFGRGGSRRNSILSLSIIPIIFGAVTLLFLGARKREGSPNREYD